MINACLIGAGRIGRVHAKHISECLDARLYSVVDPNEKVLQEMAGKYGVKVTTTVEEALQDPKVDAVCIAAQTDQHCALIEAAARAGKPIFCEKPIDLDMEKIDRCLEVLRVTGVPFLLGFNRRFDPSFQELHRRLRRGDVGAIEQISITSRDFQLPSVDYLRTSGGLLRDMTIHDFDMMRWLLDDELTEVFVEGSCLIDPSIDSFGDLDTCAVCLRSERGAIGQIANSRRSVFGYDQRIEVFGAKGLLSANNAVPDTLKFSSSTGEQTTSPYPSFPERYEVAYQREIDHFFTDVVKSGKKPLVTAEDGRKALVIANAATDSYRKKQRISIDAGLINVSST
ncbi:MAG: inositol 2-dehydrogenase [Chlamydiia bacterium]|nr:inositol 2-dehydrogenase [Chlamydiia bacterium]